MQCSGKSLAGNLVLLARHVQIVHHIPGRIRLRLLPSIAKVADKIEPDRLMKSVPGIIDARFRMAVGSIVIEYDSNRLPPDLWEQMVKRNNGPEAASEIEARIAQLFDSCS